MRRLTGLTNISARYFPEFCGGQLYCWSERHVNDILDLIYRLRLGKNRTESLKE